MRIPSRSGRARSWRRQARPGSAIVLVLVLACLPAGRSSILSTPLARPGPPLTSDFGLRCSIFDVPLRRPPSRNSLDRRPAGGENRSRGPVVGCQRIPDKGTAMDSVDLDFAALRAPPRPGRFPHPDAPPLAGPRQPQRRRGAEGFSPAGTKTGDIRLSLPAPIIGRAEGPRSTRASDG